MHRNDDVKREVDKRFDKLYYDFNQKYKLRN